MLDNTDLSIMEISSADGSTSALFEVHDAEANSAPAKSELIFNKYGNRYFLAKLFDEGNPNGSTVDESRYEKKSVKRPRKPRHTCRRSTADNMETSGPLEKQLPGRESAALAPEELCLGISKKEEI